MKAAIFKFHHRLAWVAGIAALTWGLSGFGHPIMVWLSPRPVVFSAPSAEIDLKNALSPGAVMMAAGMSQALEVRSISHMGQSFYLLREEAESPRRYFDPKTGVEVEGIDHARAELLARHYLGDQESTLVRADYLTGFTNDYPEINRLLPVWRVVLDGNKARTAYVDTGTGQLATIDSPTRAAMRFLFVNIHTLEFLSKDLPWVRVLIIFIMVGTLWCAAVLGVALLVTLKTRKKQEHSRKWHRTIGYAAMIPALMFTSSGLYHLLHDASRETSAFKNTPPVPLIATDLMLPPHAYLKGDETLAGMNAVRGAGGTSLLRFALMQQETANGGAEHAHHQANADHMKRMENQPEVFALWFHADSALMVDGGAEAVAQSLAQESLGIDASDILMTSPVTRFSGEYGFLNKRLPVWRLALKGTTERRVFVDAANGVIAAEVDASDIRELWVFDTLHKWQFMVFLGRIPRDIISMIAVVMVISAAVFGWVLQLRRIKHRT